MLDCASAHHERIAFGGVMLRVIADPTRNVSACCAACAALPACTGWTLHRGQKSCWLKARVMVPARSRGAVSGVKHAELVKCAASWTGQCNEGAALQNSSREWAGTSVAKRGTVETLKTVGDGWFGTSWQCPGVRCYATVVNVSHSWLTVDVRNETSHRLVRMDSKEARRLGAPPFAPAGAAVTYAELADAILGVGVRPFAQQANTPADTRPSSFWYTQSYFARQHADLAEHLMRLGGEGRWVLEVGSFLGDSALAWVRAARAVGLRNATVVAMDTWLGDVGMWQRKGRWLGPPDAVTGEPRLFEVFLANVRQRNATDSILPLRVPSSVGLRYLAGLVESGRLPPPHVVYLDAAHEYPETELEMHAAWRLLPRGGFLVGDDFNRHAVTPPLPSYFLPPLRLAFLETEA
jgi:hypothetical protein